MQDRPTLSWVAQKAIAELRNLAVEPTLDEVLWLHELGLKVENPAGRGPGLAAGFPVRCGAVLLWPLTIGAGQWFSDVALPIFGQSTQSFLCLAYAHAHARRPDVLEELTTRKTIWQAVRRWCRAMTLTPRELEICMARLQGKPAQDEPAKLQKKTAAADQAEWEDILAYLAVNVGEAVETWRWQIDRSIVLTIIRQYKRLSEEDGERLDPDDPANVAAWNLHQAKLAIMDAHGVEPPQAPPEEDAQND